MLECGSAWARVHFSPSLSPADGAAMVLVIPPICLSRRQARWKLGLGLLTSRAQNCSLFLQQLFLSLFLAPCPSLSYMKIRPPDCRGSCRRRACASFPICAVTYLAAVLKVNSGTWLWGWMRKVKILSHPLDRSKLPNLSCISSSGSGRLKYLPHTHAVSETICVSRVAQCLEHSECSADGGCCH